jgi:hypothetical protein
MPSSLIKDWASYSATALAAIYVAGYLVLRYHLTALGISTDLSVLDERYLFAGARFLIYLASVIPIVVLLLCITIAPFWGLFWIVGLISTSSGGERVSRVGQGFGRTRVRLGDLLSRSFGRIRDAQLLYTLGIILSVVLIQLVMRQCFSFYNLLTRAELPSPDAFHSLLTGGEGIRLAYMIGLLIGLASVIALYAAGRRAGAHSKQPQFLKWLLVFCITFQALLVPINYGVYFDYKWAPRAKIVGEGAPVDAVRLWLIWEGPEEAVFLAEPINFSPGSEQTRHMLTIQKKKLNRIELECYDRIFAVVFSGGASCAP